MTVEMIVRGVNRLTEEGVAKVYRALGDPTRLRIVRLLCRHEELGCGDLAEELGIARPTLSHHTGVLQECRLISVRKEGTFHFFHVNRDTLEQYAPIVSALDGSPSPGR